jgi:hypothetical protein
LDRRPGREKREKGGGQVVAGRTFGNLKKKPVRPGITKKIKPIECMSDTVLRNDEHLVASIPRVPERGKGSSPHAALDGGSHRAWVLS